MQFYTFLKKVSKLASPHTTQTGELVGIAVKSIIISIHLEGTSRLSKNSKNYCSARVLPSSL